MLEWSPSESYRVYERVGEKSRTRDLDVLDIPPSNNCLSRLYSGHFRVIRSMNRCLCEFSILNFKNTKLRNLQHCLVLFEFNHKLHCEKSMIIPVHWIKRHQKLKINISFFLKTLNSLLKDALWQVCLKLV